MSFSVVILIIFSAISGFGPAASLIDEDGDGIFDWSDNCPSISNSIQADNDISLGTDGGNACDPDDDNDSWTDENEIECGTDPLDSTSVPTDNDGDYICNIVDEDDDNDGFDDVSEIGCQSNPFNVDDIPIDQDLDGICDFLDLDIDGDGWSNEEEIFCDSDQYNSASKCQISWEIDGRMAWEVDLLFDTCDSRNGDWQWPENLSSQDDVFLYPGELSCVWEIQGNGDLGTIAIYSHVEYLVELNLSIIGNGVEFTESSSTWQVVTIEPHRAALIEIKIIDENIEGEISIIAEADGIGEVQLDLQIFQGSEQRDIHIARNDHIEVHYKIWDADTGELLDEGTLEVTAGDDPTYIEGFVWSAIGLDGSCYCPDSDLIDSTIQRTLLPPPIAYGSSEGHELEDSWLVFELEWVDV